MAFAEPLIWGRCLAWYDASLGRWRPPVQIRPAPLLLVTTFGSRITRKILLNLFWSGI